MNWNQNVIQICRALWNFPSSLLLSSLRPICRAQPKKISDAIIDACQYIKRHTVNCSVKFNVSLFRVVSLHWNLRCSHIHMCVFVCIRNLHDIFTQLFLSFSPLVRCHCVFKFSQFRCHTATREKILKANRRMTWWQLIWKSTLSQTIKFETKMSFFDRKWKRFSEGLTNRLLRFAATKTRGNRTFDCIFSLI